MANLTPITYNSHPIMNGTIPYGGISTDIQFKTRLDIRGVGVSSNTYLIRTYGDK